jgi:hypothetical protein
VKLILPERIAGWMTARSLALEKLESPLLIRRPRLQGGKNVLCFCVPCWVDISHRVIGLSVNLMEAVFGWVKALHTRISSSILYRGLSFQRGSVQCANHCIYALEVFGKSGAVCVFGVEGPDSDAVLLLKIFFWRDECDDFECVSRPSRRN